MRIPETTAFPKYLIIRLPDVNAYFNFEITVIALALRALENNKWLSMTLSNDFKYFLLQTVQIQYDKTRFK